MKTPKISIVMPAYNHEKFVGEAMESVLGQTYPDFEFIIINDGSSDGTEKIIKNYDDNRIRYFYQENMGAHNALNRGISMADGEYISIINSDDVYHQERLSKLVQVAEQKGAKFIFTDLDFMSNDNEYLEIHSKWYEKLKSIYKRSGSLIVAFLSGNIAVTTSNFFFRSEIIDTIGQFKSYRYAHDYDYALRILSAFTDNFIYESDKKLLSYRLHNENTIRESYARVNTETIDLLAKNSVNLIGNIEDRASIASIMSYIGELNDYVARDILYKDEVIAGKNKLIADIQNTYSWKITSPLRWLMHIIKPSNRES